MVAEGIRMARLSIATLAVMFGACGGPSSKPVPPPPPPPPAPKVTTAAPDAGVPSEPGRVFSDAEIAAYETGLLARVAVNKSLVCKRPVLRGTPTTGPADADIIAFTEPSGALADCLRETRALEDGGARLRDVVASRSPAVLALVKRCGPLLEAAIGTAIAHEDACSPYLAGRRVEPPELMTPIAAAHILGVYVQLRAERGDPVGAMWLVAEAARMFQDLGRGPTFLMPPMIGNAATRLVLEVSQPIVDKLTRKQAAQLVPVFDALVASEPRFGDVLRGEAQYMGLMTGLANMKGSDWVPPGGTRVELQQDNRLVGGSFHPLDEAALLVGTAEQLERDLVTACPADATYKACVEGLQAMAAKATSPTTDKATVHKTLVELATRRDTPENREKVRLEIKQLLLDITSNVARPRYAGYVANRAMGVGRLVATRIALGVRQTGTCPTTSPPNSALGAELELEREGKTLKVVVPKWARNPEKPEDSVVRTIRCP